MVSLFLKTIFFDLYLNISVIIAARLFSAASFSVYIL